MRNTAVLSERESVDDASRSVATQGAVSPAVEALNRAQQEHWRQEVISRVRQHRTRRRRFDPTASLELNFPETSLAIAIQPAEAQTVSLPPTMDDEVVQDVVADQPVPLGHRQAATVRSRPPKIIRFPRLAPAPLADVPKPAWEELELAGPALETPRILDAPEAEQMELLPSFADIRLEEAPPQPGLDHELDSLPQPASISRRFASGLVDGAIVVAGIAVFAAIFFKITEAAPRTREAWLCAVAVSGTLWLLFQFLFLVYGKRTPGMGAVHLELLTFNGNRPSVLARCGRALATTLSGFSVGLGFAWALVDEDTLGWHDRISQTYLRSGDRVIR